MFGHVIPWSKLLANTKCGHYFHIHTFTFKMSVKAPAHSCLMQNSLRRVKRDREYAWASMPSVVHLWALLPLGLLLHNYEPSWVSQDCSHVALHSVPLQSYTNFYTAQRPVLSMIKKDRELIKWIIRKSGSVGYPCVFVPTFFVYSMNSMQSVKSSNVVGWTMVRFPLLLK